MADPKPPEKSSIPAWQKGAQENSSKESANETKSSTNESNEQSRRELLEQGKEFLLNEAIQNAPREEKVAFLEKKGLKLADIDTLLKSEEPDQEELKTIHDTSTSTENKRTLDVEEAQPRNIVPKASQPREQVADVPPIITYPEFLLKPQKPPPLITVERLLNATYALAGISALTWGASKYLIDPMLQNLTEARHDLAEAALQDLEKLNTKLETSVSHVPYIATAAALKNRQDTFSEDDADSIVSDPTELFHRDIATQTTPSLSRSNSTTMQDKPADPTALQASKLASLHAQLAGLSASQSMASNTSARVSESLRMLQGKIDDMHSSYNLLTSTIPSYTSISTGKDKSSTQTQANSEGAKFKAEIRSLKGVFLSSRNFAAVPRSMSPASAGYVPS